jgi:hypothetical protein
VFSRHAACMQKTEIPKVGWFGLFKDLDGSAIGLFTPKK